MKKLRIVAIGNRGHWGYMLQALKDLPVEVVAYATGCEDDPQKMGSVLSDFGQNPKYYCDYREMLDLEQPDAVCIDGPFERHAEMVIEALNRSVNVFCEKPIALNQCDLQKIQKAYSKTSGVALISMVGLRTEPPFMTAWQAVNSGIVGKVKMVSARKSYKLGNRREFYKHRDSYGGTIPWVGSHALDWIMWFGGADFETVDGFHNHEDNCDHGDLEMCAVVQGRLNNGVLFSATIDYLRPAAAATHGDDQVRIAGTSGIVEVRHGKVFVIDSAGERELPVTPCEGIFHNFARHLLYGEPLITSGQDSISLTAGCLKARDDADKKQRINYECSNCNGE